MKLLIQMCGDPTVDWFRIHNEDIIVRGGVYYWTKQQQYSKVKLSSKPGGSAMVLQLLQEMIAPENAILDGSVLSEELLSRPKDSRITTSWTVWREFGNPGLNYNSFRLEKWHEFEPGSWDYKAARLQGFPDLLIIQDSGLGFRDCQAGWPEVLKADPAGKHPRDIILKLGQYNESRENLLLDRIIKLDLANRTTIVTTLSDLRSCPVRIGISLSWERILEEVVAAVLNKNCPFLDMQTQRIKYKQVIVTLGASGAVIIDKDTSTLVFDRSGQEGEFADIFPGQMMGYHTCLLGSLAAEWSADPEAMDWIKATCLGIKLARALHVQGYETMETNNYRQLQFPNKFIAGLYQSMISQGNEKFEYPYDLVNDLGCFSTANYNILNKKDRNQWTILEENLLRNKQYRYSFPDPQSGVNECARNIVVSGPLAALPDIPVETVGAWSSADRHEIEGVRSVNNAMKDYLDLKDSGKPLCVAVFGPPGAGKSFVVKEIAKGLGIKEEAQLTFNLSQFESPRELQTAFNEIRDLNLKGVMPLVFWDEFDTPCEGRPLGWLRYFLAPMQDGEYTDQGVPRPLGKGIYVFAGATRYSLEDFQNGDSAWERDAKKPDFISRLRAYINIRGINGSPNSVEDRLFMIRRAFLLRQYLETNVPQIRVNNQFAIEAGVLDAFLRVTKYSHGARSLENLVKMSNLADKRKFELSSLPPDNIIAMHTNVKEFKDLATMGQREMLRIGITGHKNLDKRQIKKIETAVDEAISFIERKFPRNYLTVFSPLAAGADRLVARRLLERDATRLIAVLPFDQDNYINEFGSTDDYLLDKEGAELRQELKYWLSQKAQEIIEMPLSPTRRAAYLKAGNFIAENSDILIAVWDGNEDPESSITAQIVARALSLHKPVCHIWADNMEADDKITIGEVKCGELSYLNFSCQE